MNGFEKWFYDCGADNIDSDGLNRKQIAEIGWNAALKAESQKPTTNKQSTPCRFEPAHRGMKDGGMVYCSYCGVKL